MKDTLPTMAILTEAIRRDNHAPLRFFRQIKVVHLYGRAPYQDMAASEFAGAVKYTHLFNLYRQLLKLEPDIIQGSEPLASRHSLFLSIVALLAARKLRVPLIFPTLENRTLADRLPRSPISHALAPIIRWYWRKYCRTAFAIMALNNGAAANLRAAGVTDAKIVRFPWGFWGVDRTVFRRQGRAPHAVFKQPVILFVGRLDPEKGIRDILDAFSRLAEDNPDWQLVFVGRGQLEEEIRIFARAHRLPNRIHLLGLIPNRELPAYFSAAAVTVYPSITVDRGEESAIQGWSEQVGTVILQSMACGTPVVATTSGAIPEYLTADTGLLVPERDPDALARAIAKVLNDPSLRAKLSRNAERHIAAKYDAKINVARAEDMILSWLGQ